MVGGRYETMSPARISCARAYPLLNRLSRMGPVVRSPRTRLVQHRSYVQARVVGLIESPRRGARVNPRPLPCCSGELVQEKEPAPEKQPAVYDLEVLVHSQFGRYVLVAHVTWHGCGFAAHARARACCTWLVHVRVHVHMDACTCARECACVHVRAHASCTCHVHVPHARSHIFMPTNRIFCLRPIFCRHQIFRWP